MTVEPIDVRELLGHAGSSRAVSVFGTLAGLRTELAELPDDAPVEADVVLESVVEGILVSGSLQGRIRIRCARCLKGSERPFDVEVAELFSEDLDPDDDAYPIERPGWIQLEQLIRDALGVELPFSPLCRPDCAGLCPVCGGDRNLGECPGHDEIDPRFAVLSGLFPDRPGPDA